MREGGDQRVKFTHEEASEEFDMSRIGEVERILVDIFLEGWLKEKGLKTDGRLT